MKDGEQCALGVVGLVDAFVKCDDVISEPLAQHYNANQDGFTNPSLFISCTGSLGSSARLPCLAPHSRIPYYNNTLLQLRA